jgi:hypothetical protein
MRTASGRNSLLKLAAGRYLTSRVNCGPALRFSWQQERCLVAPDFERKTRERLDKGVRIRDAIAMTIRLR